MTSPTGADGRSPAPRGSPAGPGPHVVVSLDQAAATVVVRLAGVLTARGAGVVSDLLMRSARLFSPRVCLDLSACSDCHVEAITVLMGTDERLRALGGGLRVEGAAYPRLLSTDPDTDPDRP